MKIKLKLAEWKSFLDKNPDIYESLWDLIPKEMEVISIEKMVWTGSNLYHISYRDRNFLALDSCIDELIKEDGDEARFEDYL
jgi:hypothetical protein